MSTEMFTLTDIPFLLIPLAALIALAVSFVRRRVSYREEEADLRERLRAWEEGTGKNSIHEA